MRHRTGAQLRFCRVTTAFCAAFAGAASLCAAGPGGPDSTTAGPFASVVHPYLEEHCFECHDDTTQKGGLRLDNLAPTFADDGAGHTWVDVFDKLSSNEMPPKKKPRPDAAQTRQVLAWIKGGVSAVELARRNAAGRVILRRLNRSEYENTVRDLLGIDVELKGLLPEDASSMGFDNVADALSVSSVLMERYLEAADVALGQAIAVGPAPPTKHWSVAYGPVTNRPDDYRLKSGMRSLDDGTFVLFNSGDVPITCDRFKAPVEGEYRFRIPAYAYQSPDQPLTMSVLAGSFDARSPNVHTIGYFDVGPDPAKPRMIEFTQRLPKNGTCKIMSYHLGRRSLDKPELVKAYTGPGIAVARVEVDGPLNESWPPASMRRLFGELDVDHATIADAARVLQPFAARAFRRPVDGAELTPYVDLAKSRLDAGESFVDAMRVAMKAILCAPDFLFLKERSGKLDDYAVASRLSYFLWSSMPDDELTRRAADHSLTRPDALRAQVERMLNDKRARAFTLDFTDQWLGLRQIDATTPDRRLYPGFDDLLQWSMVEETHRFFDELLTHDASVANFIDSDFAMLNGPLAQLYSIDGVGGAEIRKVPLPAGSHRGGVLTQASVLKVTANGTSTSPVVRGAWVMRNILGQPPKPPPPNVPAIEPDTRGATTIRELLEKHRSQATCAACHAHIDPPGFALESFDVIGGWRDNYHTFGGGTAGNSYLNGKNKYKPWPALDSSATLPDGRTFKNFDEFRQLLLADKDQVTRCLAEKLLIYSTGAGLDFIDRPAVDGIVAQTRDHGYGLRTMVHEVVESPLFLSK
jgi:mono/diheme cytochrome c family protein